ncbi:hypothetical protein_gp037 [Bacillus phage vB_BceM_WH1]|nr:hypothetical protein_gp037 [Bacillus phage vB_BceM_WH1]
MTKQNQNKEVAVTEVPGIYLSSHNMSNMVMQRIVVSNPAILKVLEIGRLTEKAQQQAVQDLVARTPEWLDLSTEVQIEKIKTVLTQESVIAYLQKEKVIKDNVDTIEVGIDPEGSVVIEACYVQMNREQRRNMMKNTSKKEQEELKSVVNALGGENIIDLAQRKLDRMKAKKGE